MKRLLAIFIVLGITLHAAYAEGIDKVQYKEVSLTEYKAAGAVPARDDTERFKLTLKFQLQLEKNAVFRDGESPTLQSFTSEEKLNLTRGQDATLYIHSVHSPDGTWADEIIDLVELKR
jgi:hypothetical protein